MGVRLTSVSKTLPGMGRGVVAVIVGYIVAVALILVSFGILGSTMPDAFPKPGEEPTVFILVLTLVISAISSIISGVVIGAMVRYSARAYAVILGIFMILMGIVSMILEQGAKPVWWHLTIFVLIIPCTVMGASLRKKR